MGRCTFLEFNMAKQGQVRLEFYDVTGKIIHSKRGAYDRGEQKMTIKRTDLNTSGIVYVKMITDENISEYKMMVIK